MRYVVTDIETIPEWLYPGTWPDLETPIDHSMTVACDFSLAHLWALVAPDAVLDSALVRQSFEDVGIPHGAPDFVERVCDDLISSLLQIPVHERWRIAQQWAGNPNTETLSIARQYLRRFCELAELAVAEGKNIVVVPDPR